MLLDSRGQGHDSRTALRLGDRRYDPGRGAGGAQEPFAIDLIPRRSALDRLGLERQWFGVIPLVETERLLKITLGNGLLFAQTSYAMLHTYDAESGRLLWSSQLGERTGFARGVASNSFAVYVSNADTFYALDRATGRMVWRYDFGKIPTSQPVCDEELAMIGLTTGKIYGFTLKHKADDGKETILTSPLEAFNWQTGGPMLTRPLPAEHVVAFGSSDGKVYLVMSEERTPLFRISTGGPIGQGLGSFGTRILLIPSADNNLYAVDIFTAGVVWTFPSARTIEQEPMVADQDIYSTNTAGILTSLEPATGAPRWRTSTQDGQLVSISGAKIYLRSRNRDLFLVDRKSGRVVVDPGETFVRAGLSLREYNLNIVNRFNDRMYFATGSGMIVCLREAGQAQPRPSKIRRRCHSATSRRKASGRRPPRCLPMTPRLRRKKGRATNPQPRKTRISPQPARKRKSLPTRTMRMQPPNERNRRPDPPRLLSVHDKSGLIELAGALSVRGVKLLASGGTHQALVASGFEVEEVAGYTGQPEILSGRVKTLHPKIHAGILARRDAPTTWRRSSTRGFRSSIWWW